MKKLLLGTSVIALSVIGYNSSANAHVLSGCTGAPITRTVECLDYKGRVIPTTDSRYATHCNIGTIGTAEPANTNGNCSISCPHNHVSGGEGGGNDSVGSHDTDGDGVSDTPGENGPAGTNTSDPVGSPVGNGGGGGGGGGGGTVLCTYFHRLGLLSDDDYYNGFIYSLNNSHAATWRGYHFWAVPYVEHLYKNPNSVLAKIIKPVVIHRAKEISYQLGLENKPDYLGKIFRSIIEPISFSIGLFVKQKDFSSLYTKRELAMFARKHKNYKRMQEFKEQGLFAGTPMATFTV